MKIDDKISQERLEKEGWIFITNFGNCQIYGKEKTRILWNPVTQLIKFIFHDCQYI